MVDTADKVMQRVFDENTLGELKELYKTGEWTKTALANKYGCSVTTVCLWLNPNEEVRVQKFKSRVTKLECDCGTKHEDHARCHICKVQTHSEEELKTLPDYYKIGLSTTSTKMCDSCYERFSHMAMQLRAYYKNGDVYSEYTLTINPHTKEIIS